MKKKLIKTFILIFSLILLFSACGKNTETDDSKKTVIATNFVAYDFARQLLGDIANVSMLLPVGTESHTYEPTAQDILKIQSCDLLIYNGGESEEWIDSILESLPRHIETFRMIDCVELLSEDGEEDEYDEHVWTSPANALKIVASLNEKLNDIFPEDADNITANTNQYSDELFGLYLDFAEAFSDESNKVLVFGDRFPFKYLVNEFGVEYHAAFSGCSSETEPDAKVMSELINIIKEKNIDRVFCIEFSSENIACAISDATGVKIRKWDSCHNVTKDQFDAGETYISLMKNNIAALQD